MREVQLVKSAVVTAILALWPAIAFAQATSELAGVVKDTTGAVLPGVTVEATSPVLIEKVRTAITDDQGQYKIVDLRPGVYTVTFALSGFGSLKREGIELPAAFTATVNAELRVGALEETVTVSGQSPVVDVQTVRQQTVLSHEVMDLLPSQRSPQSYVPYVAGVSGGLGDIGRDTAALSIHGSRTNEANVAIDGVADHTFEGPGGGAFTYYINQGSVQEVAVSTGGQSAEQGVAGITTNLIPKEGSNTFTGDLFLGYVGEGLQADNLSDELKATGLTAVNHLKKNWDVNPSWGGRIVKDKLWFFNSYRYWGTITYLAGLYYNLTPLAFSYTPDFSRQAVAKIVDGSENLRLTYQATPKNKISAFWDNQPHCTCNYPGFVATTSPEATGYGKWKPNGFRQASWKSPATNRLYLEASISQVFTNWYVHPQIDPPVAPDTIGVTAQTGTVTIYRAYTPTNRGQHKSNPVTTKASATYVTGSHAFKVGFSLLRGRRWTTQEIGGDVTYRVNNAFNPTPNQITEYATPLLYIENLNADMGVFAQDQWTIKRLTLNVGLRYDYFDASVPPQQLPATRFLPARSYGAVENIPHWQDVSPRLGIAYDLFGNGKTALKFNLARFVLGEAVATARNNNPIQTSITSVTRTWSDGNRDFVPDCNLNNPLANGECGQISPLGFGEPNTRATRYDADVLEGFGKRGYNWELSAAVQRELRPGVSLNLEYDRRSYGNQTATNNLALSPASYDQFCITAPADSRLPRGGGEQICGLYDLTSAGFNALPNNLVTFTKNLGGQTEVYNGFDAGLKVRLARGVQLSGGVSTSQTVTDICALASTPQIQPLTNAATSTAVGGSVASSARFCHVSAPFRAGVKGFAVYPLPWWGLQTSAALQVVPGPQILASYVAGNDVIRPSLGRNLSAGSTATVNIPLIEPGTQFEPYIRNLDMRIARTFKSGPARIMGSLDLFNVLNRSDVITLNTTYGDSWLRPTQTLVGRYLKVGVQITY